MKKAGAVIIEGHVQGLSNTRTLGEAGIPVVVVDKNNCIARYSKYCNCFYKCPNFNREEFVTFLLKLGEKEKLKGWALLPSNDHAVFTISKHKNQLERYYKVITPGLDIIKNIYDKSKLLKLAEKFLVPIPATQYYESVDNKISDKLKYPVITKGRYGLSFYKAINKKALLAKDEEELKAQLQLIARKYRVDSTLTQELIPFNGSNHTISFTAFCVYGDIKTYWMGVKLREHPLRFGTATFAKSVYIPECYDLSVPLLKTLNYTGVCEVEYLFDPETKQYKLIEINARTWLWVGLAKACGVDYAKMIYNFVNHYAIDYPQTYETGKCWINPITDLAYGIYGMLKGKVNPGIYLSSLTARRKVNALFSRRDVKPGFAYLFGIRSFLNQR